MELGPRAAAEGFLTRMRRVEVRLVEVFRDGNQWCALLGGDIQDGMAGFGDSRADALIALAVQLDDAGDSY